MTEYSDVEKKNCCGVSSKVKKYKLALPKKPGVLQNLDLHQLTFVGFFDGF